MNILHTTLCVLLTIALTVGLAPLIVLMAFGVVLLMIYSLVECVVEAVGTATHRRKRLDNKTINWIALDPDVEDMQ